MKTWNPLIIIACVLGLIGGYRLHDTVDILRHREVLWVNTSSDPRGCIHHKGCRYYQQGHGYMTKYPPREARECRICGKPDNHDTIKKAES